MTPPHGMQTDGRKRFVVALKRFIRPRPPGGLPQPSSPWEAWADYRLAQLEDRQTWMLRLLVGALVGQFILDVFKII
jgi:hypothetical protein